MKQTLVIKYVGDDKETVIPFKELLEKDSPDGWLVMVDTSDKMIYVNVNNCKYFYFREEEKKYV